MTDDAPKQDLQQQTLQHLATSHGKFAADLRSLSNPLNGVQIRSGLATLHEGLATLALAVAGKQPTANQHDEYHKVRQTHLYQMAATRFSSAAEIAVLGMRSAIIANGGALIAMLAFLGNSHRTPSGTTVWFSFAFFVAGLLSSLLTLLFGYGAQSSYGRQEAAGSDKIYFHMIGDPQVPTHEAEEDRQMKIGRRWEHAAIVAYLVALALFIAGAVAGVDALSVMPSTQ